MALGSTYASISVVELHSDGVVTIETISVSPKHCELSGAWELQIQELDKIKSILLNNLVVSLSDEDTLSRALNLEEIRFIHASELLGEAKSAISDALNSYEEFKAEDAKKRKKLVAPDFYEWPETADFRSAIQYMSSINKLSYSEATPIRMRNTLSTAKMVKHFVDMWHRDEQERTNRKYVDGVESEVTILPSSWLSS